ncbi:MAG: hypothetical protein Q7R86_02765 [bacterium]|nr:hypothetical protein [bacterium]
MTKEIKTCQNCKQNFIIELEDFAFYERIQVPPPTFCPECRLQRRMTWRNERTLYHTKCAATGKNIISMFDPESPIVVYDHDYWWSDNWDQLASGRDYDFSKPFFVQFRELLEKAPLPNLANTNVINSDYGNHNADMKNCYLTYASFENENVDYSRGAHRCKDSMDLYVIEKAEQSYESVECDRVSRVFFSYDADDSVNCYFLNACDDMTDSTACINLDHKSNHIFNQPHTKEDYKRQLGNFDFGSHQKLEEFKEKFKKFIENHPRRFSTIIKSQDSTGDMVVNSKNCKYSFDVYDNAEDCKYIIHALNIKDSYDGYGFGANSDLLYEGIDSGIDASQYKFTTYAHKNRNIEYVYACHSSDNLFGCVGLRNKKYCVLNKQYTKEEYKTLVPKIKKHMEEMPYIDKKGRVYKYGEFFPTELSPFAYNETIAQEYFPINQERAEQSGFSWKSPKEKSYQTTIKANELPDHIKDVEDGILNETIACEHAGKYSEQCTTAFKIIPQELQFYRQFNFPLPRLCPNCRHYQRLKQRNAFRLWHRKCQCESQKSSNGKYSNIVKHFHGDTPCTVEFETPYSPDRPEIIYCEKCYQEETA